MTMNEVERTINLDPTQIFDHTAILKDEINNFQSIFQRNEQEFAGLIKKNHMIYEANDMELLAILKKCPLKELNLKISNISHRLERVAEPYFKLDTFKDIDLTSLTPTDILRITEAELKKPGTNHLENIFESPESGENN